jgi:hypothetical protein
MSRMIRLLALSAMVSSPAYAWKHTGFIWTAAQLPITYHVADDPTDADGICYSSIRSGDCRGAVEFSAQAWEDVPCTDIELAVSEEPIDNAHATRNGITEVVFDDPNGIIDNPSALAVTFSTGSGGLYEVNGQIYNQLNDADIVFQRDGQFVTDADIEAGQCGGRTSLDNTMLHEMGHSLGLGHSCDEEDICTDPSLLAATMFWTSGGPCDLEASSLNDDDQAGFRALYGPFATFECSHENASGNVLEVVPFDLKCVVSSDRVPDIQLVEWGFGDGSVETGLTASHEYTVPGNYTVTVKVEGVSEECVEEGEENPEPWAYEYRQVGYVTACSTVQAEFTAEAVRDFTYQMRNESDVSVYGCITEISWSVYEGDGVSGEPLFTASAWEPEFSFPDRGTYTVLMNLGGPAGTTGATLTFDVVNNRDEGGGCDSVGGLGLGSMALSALLLGVRRRRS